MTDENHLHAPAQAAPKPRFERTSCSQCGKEFGPGDSGYSHCSDHEKAKPYEAWAPWHPQHGFQDEFMSATWISTDLDEIARRVKRLNEDDKTNARNGWRAVKVTLSRLEASK